MEFPDHYTAKMAQFGSSDDQQMIKLAFDQAVFSLEDRCQLLEINPFAFEQRPVFWALTIPEMVVLREALSRRTDAVATVLREQFDVVLKSCEMLLANYDPSEEEGGE